MVVNPHEKLWKGKCTISVKEKYQNSVNKRTELRDKIIYEDRPCKLSYQRKVISKDAEGASIVFQEIRLFASKDMDIPAGSKIIVTQNGKTAEYNKSGQPAIYTHHQEIQLEFKEWA